jgi:hypothetical protein
MNGLNGEKKLVATNRPINAATRSDFISASIKYRIKVSCLPINRK